MAQKFVSTERFGGHNMSILATLVVVFCVGLLLVLVITEREDM